MKLFIPDEGCMDSWSRGVKLAGAQNLARDLMEHPANHLTPILFAEQVVQQMQGLPVDIKVRLV